MYHLNTVAAAAASAGLGERCFTCVVPRGGEWRGLTGDGSTSCWDKNRVVSPPDATRGLGVLEPDYLLLTTLPIGPECSLTTSLSIRALEKQRG